MSLPKIAFKIVESAVAKYPSSSRMSYEEACEKIRRHPDYKSWVNDLVDRAIQSLVYESRRTDNQKTKAILRSEIPLPKVIVGKSRIMAEVNREEAELIFNYKIGGTQLGDLYGRELAPLAQRWRRNAEEGFVNARSLELLAEITPSDRRVRDAVSKNKILEVADLSGLRCHLHLEMSEAGM